jgi:arginase
MSRFAVLDAPSNLGLRPTGVERLPDALREAGLLTALQAEDAGRVVAPPYSGTRDPTTHLLNGETIRAYSRHLADAIAPLREAGYFPVVLGGDCSILLGAMLSVRREGQTMGQRYGLFFIDGHADFYQPEAEPKGEVASMELALLSGRGPTVLSNIEGRGPLVRDEDIVAFAFRDTEEADREGSQDIRAVSVIHTYSLSHIRDAGGIAVVAPQALTHLVRGDLAGFWIHLDADVLDDAIMPAVDYRLPGGLSFSEVSELLRILYGSGHAIGLTVTIFNPALDENGVQARALVDCIAAGLHD